MRMRPTAAVQTEQRSVSCLCLSVNHDREPCKTAEPIEMPFKVEFWGTHWLHLANKMDRCAATAMRLSLPLLQQLV